MGQIIIIDSNGQSILQLKSIIAEMPTPQEVFTFKLVTEFQRILFSPPKQPSQSDQPKADNEKKKQKPEIDWSKVSLIIADVETCSVLLEKNWSDLLNDIGKRNSDQKMPTLVMTGFVESSYPQKPIDFRHPLFFAYVNKPFDRLLVKQFLLCALKGPGPLQPDDIYSQKGEGVIEIIKDIEIEALTELGFRTLSSRVIEPGKVARYFGQPFKCLFGSSVFGYSYNSRPSEKVPGKFHSSFSYLGIGREQISAIRRQISKDPDKEELNFPTQPEGSTKKLVSALVLTKDKDSSQKIKELLLEKFSNINVIFLSSIHDLIPFILPEKLSQLDKGLMPDTAFPPGAEVEWTFPKSNYTLLSLEMNTAEGKKTPPKVLGQVVTRWLKKDISFENNKVFDEAFKQAHIDQKIKPDMIYSFRSAQNNHYYLRITSATQIKDPDQGELVKIKMKELTPKERISFLIGHYPGIDQIDLCFLDHGHKKETIESIKNIVRLSKTTNTPTKYFVLSEKAITSYANLPQAEFSDDHFIIPLDYFYFSRKVKMHCEDLIFVNPGDNHRLSIPFEAGIKTALPVTITAISEVHLSLIYNRQLSVGAIRRFVLWIPNESDMPEIEAVCHYSEEQEDGTYRCDFLFYAIQDNQLKYIRLWIREYYVQSKKGK